MNRWQKIAWFNLIVMTVSLLLTAAAVGTLAAIIGMPAALGGLGFLGLCGLVGFEPILFRKKQGQSTVDFDERDLLIDRKATLGAFAVSYVYFVGVCMIIWFVVGSGGVIRVVVLPLIVAGGFITSQLVRSIALLVQYGRKENYNE
jgi:hypothetical protein